MTARVRFTPRQSAARRSIPSYVQLPKFLTSADIRRIVEHKLVKPKLSWSSIVDEVILASFAEKQDRPVKKRKG